MNKMKRSLVVVAAVFAMASTSAMASKAVQMTDEQLDEITAAGASNAALSAVVINNPGKANVARNLDLAEGNHATCINCGLFPNEGGTGGAVVVVNRKFPDANPIIKCIGRGLQGFC